MRQISFDKLYNAKGSGRFRSEPIPLESLKKVHLELDLGNFTFDTMRYTGWISFNDDTPPLLIEPGQPVNHNFHYPQTPIMVYEDGSGAPLPPGDPAIPVEVLEDGSLWPIQRPEEDYSSPTITLYFSTEIPYGIIDGAFLSQAKSLKEPFPGWVDFPVELKFTNPDFIVEDSFTENLSARPKFKGLLKEAPKIFSSFEGQTCIPVVGAGTKMLSIAQQNGYDTETGTATTEPGRSALIYAPFIGLTACEKIRYQGDLPETAKWLMGWDLTCDSPKLKAKDILEAYPRNQYAKPEAVIDFYNCFRTEHSYIDELTDTHAFYNPTELRFFARSFEVRFRLENKNGIELRGDPLPFGPDWSECTKLEKIFLNYPGSMIKHDPTKSVSFGFGSKLTHWPWPQSLKVAASTHWTWTPEPAVDEAGYTEYMNSSPERLLWTYSEYQRQCRITIDAVDPMAEEQRLPQDEVLDCWQLPESTRVVLRYFQGSRGLRSYIPAFTSYGVKYTRPFPEVPEGVEVVVGYFDQKFHNSREGALNSFQLRIPGLPASTRILIGYLSGTFADCFIQYIDDYTEPVPIKPTTLVIEDNRFNSLEECQNFQDGTWLGASGYRRDAITSELIPFTVKQDLSDRYSELVKQIPTVEPVYAKLVSTWDPDGTEVPVY